MPASLQPLARCPTCQELNYSGATLDYIPALLHVHSRASPVYIPALLRSITGLDWTPLDLPFDQTYA